MRNLPVILLSPLICTLKGIKVTIKSKNKFCGIHTPAMNRLFHFNKYSDIKLFFYWITAANITAKSLPGEQ